QQELIKQTDRLKITEDSLAVVEELSREQKMQLELEESKNRELEAQLKFERLWRNILIWGIIIVLGFLGILLVLYKKIKSQKIQIEDQRDKLELQNKKINDSIHYAQNIQRAILPLNNQIKEVFENFIIYKPKDIVSGDFYWFGKTNNTIFLAVVDCTGHGVPGAFMSMIGNSLLNEIILEKKLQDPAKILTLLNEKVIDALRQNESDNNDGMDVCLVSFEINSKLVKFSGAKRPLYVSRKNNEIEEIKGTRKSIGGKKEGIEDFSSVEIKLESGDILYLSSDGLTDQNNKERKRFGSNKLKEILQLNIDQSMENQKLAIEKELDIFMENEEQRDDITLIGIKIN
ncbi:MAG TPA: SpoIIE family protein phosphatase, partial [Bacteroidales bacterium]|nr:SpoIIE family protein phosphatase [Bacteroidales bacterium]